MSSEPYDPAHEQEKLARNAAWASARCPQRHRSALGVQSGEGWTTAFAKLRSGLFHGSLFVLAGPRGTGKTQMAVEAIHEVIERSLHQHDAPRPPARYCEARDFFLDLRDTHRKCSKKSERDIMREFSGPQLVVFDEIAIRAETDWEDDAFFSVINKRYAALRDTILIGNFTSTTELLANIGASIASRLQETGGVIECNWPSFRALPEPRLGKVNEDLALPGFRGEVTR